MPEHNPANLGRSCGKDFSSLEGFDRHRVGTFDYTLADGLRMEPPREDGRRCLETREFEELGFQVDERGRWYDPARREGVRERLSALGRSPRRARKAA